jgi:integration host factor subunit beta
MTTHELTTALPDGTVPQVFDTIVDVLLKCGRVEIDGFGAFELVRRKPRRARNPRTGDRIDVPAKTAVRFVPARTLKNRAGSITGVPSGN